MTLQAIEGPQLQEIFAAGATRLARLRKEIDNLNVFPVPDGDTGTNMYLTFIAALQEIGTVKDDAIASVAAAAARGALAGARGNSGVILSQLLQGFANALAAKRRATAPDIAEALAAGADLAYRAVGQPVEGTILTVARRAAEAARFAAARTADLRRLSLHIYREALRALAETPDILPILKETGVVDAGGKGYVVILEGILQTFRRAHESALLEFPPVFPGPDEGKEGPSAPSAAGEYQGPIVFAYCTEFIIRGECLLAEEVRAALEGMGDCLMVVGNHQTLKVHIHSNHPGRVLETGLRFGELTAVQVNNMREQHARLKTEEKPVGVVSVALGEGLTSIMESMGADIVLSGGQTMNPSTEEIVRAAEQVAAPRVIILPNNKNVVLAAEQARKLGGKDIQVVPTTSIPQGLAALLAFDPNAPVEANLERMKTAAEGVKTGEVTSAVRDARLNGQSIRAGEYLGLAEENVFRGESLAETTAAVIAHVAGPGSLVTLYYGGDVSQATAEQIALQLQECMPEVEFEVHYGGQPLYHFIISVE
ncbi:MAG: DAK2 domain-containing protein [Thermoanaerobacterales bacterium]|nr:DAK2 domain-containing protein [Thermoanaerobacterales bacterium]